MSVRVLIAEPEQPLVDLYHRYLSSQGFDVATASDGRECLRLLCEFHPDVLVLEPELQDGYWEQLLPMIRDNPAVPTVPVIVLTRNDHGGAQEEPVREYFIKPFSMARLAESIRAAAGGKTEPTR